MDCPWEKMVYWATLTRCADMDVEERRTLCRAFFLLKLTMGRTPVSLGKSRIKEKPNLRCRKMASASAYKMWNQWDGVEKVTGLHIPRPCAQRSQKSVGQSAGRTEPPNHPGGSIILCFGMQMTRWYRMSSIYCATVSTAFFFFVFSTNERNVYTHP